MLTINVPFNSDRPVSGRTVAPGTSTNSAGAGRSDATGSWRYNSGGRSRRMIVAAGLVSIGVHCGILFGISPAKKKPARVEEKPAIAVMLLTEIKELEEPEPTITDETSTATDVATLVPMQQDLPQLPQPSDFVQQINFTSLIEKPDFSNLAVTVIPDNFRGGRKLAESIGKVFNLADLDRIPEPVIQHRPLYPVAMRREGISGTVKVGFIVDTEGRVLDPHVLETSHAGFDDAAIAAVSKWRFRAGVRAGGKVNTRMAVPIVFALTEQTD